MTNYIESGIKLSLLWIGLLILVYVFEITRKYTGLVLWMFIGMWLIIFISLWYFNKQKDEE